MTNRTVRTKSAALGGALLLGAVALAGCSSSSSSSSTTTKSTLDPDVEQVLALAHGVAAKEGLKPSEVTVTAKVSPANDSWMRFTVTPKPGASNSVQGGYGYAHQAQTWSVVATGTAQVGCPVNGQPPTVPLSVITSFELTCPTA